MKNVIAMLFLISCSVLAYAEPVAKSLSTDVVDVVCMPGDAICDVTLVNGSIQNVDFVNLTSYLSVDPSAKFVFDDDTFRYNDKGEVVSLSPTKFGGAAAQSQQPVQQQASEPPYKLDYSIAGDGSMVLKVVSMTSQLTVQDILVNEGNCRNLFSSKTLPKSIKMGYAAEVLISQSCNIVKIDVVTDQGSWTHTIR